MDILDFSRLAQSVTPDERWQTPEQASRYRQMLSPITSLGHRATLAHYNLRNSIMGTDMVSIPITLEQLIMAVQQLEPNERAQVARALIQVDLRSDLTAVIQELYVQPPVDDITDDNIMAEIKAMRQRSHLKQFFVVQKRQNRLRIPGHK